MGPNSSAQNISFSQVWKQSAGNIDLSALLGELARLRAGMSSAAESDPDRYPAIAEIASAEKAAAEQDGPSVMQHLRQAGAWALEVAKSVGADVAVTALKSAMGIEGLPGGYGTIGARWEKYRIRTMAAIRLTVYALDTHHSTRQPDERYLRSSRGGTYRCQQR